MRFLFVWYFVYTLCGQIRTITVKIYPVSYGRQHLAGAGGDFAASLESGSTRGDANTYLKEEGNKDKLQGECKDDNL
jgi:hypothetical protein